MARKPPRQKLGRLKPLHGGAVRRVRTAKGRKKYGESIGQVIGSSNKEPVRRARRSAVPEDKLAALNGLDAKVLHIDDLTPAEKVKVQREASATPEMVARLDYATSGLANIERESRLTGSDTLTAVEESRRELDRYIRHASPVIMVPNIAVLHDFLEDKRYKTIHETGQGSGGASVEGRRRAELAFFGETDTPPVYGFWYHPEQDSERQLAGVKKYGKMGLVLKHNVRERTTATAGDSLNHWGANFPNSERAGNPVQWMQAKELGVPYVERILAKAEYFEAQIHGGVTLDDVDHIRIPKSQAWLGPQLEARGLAWRLWEDDDHA